MLMILKVCGMLLVVACTTSIGISMAQALSRRVRELEGCIALLTGMEGELSYSLAPPDEAVARLEERESAQEAPFLPACAALCRKGTPFPQAWREAVEKQGGSLTREDAAIVEALADTLGQCDLDRAALEPFPREGAARHAAGRGPRTVRIPRQALPHDGPFGGSLCGGLFHLMPVLRKQAACGGRGSIRKKEF